MAVLLGYIDRCVPSMNILLVTSHHAGIMTSVLTLIQIILKIIGVSGILSLNIYVLAMLVKWNSAYSFHLETNKSLYLGCV